MSASLVATYAAAWDEKDAEARDRLLEKCWASDGVYVDPEDWSSERTRYLPPLAPGGSIEVPWTVKAVNSGHLAVYVTVLGAGRPVIGPALDARVASRTTIDAGGALPLAVGVPALLGVAALGVRRRRPR